MARDKGSAAVQRPRPNCRPGELSQHSYYTTICEIIYGSYKPQAYREGYATIATCPHPSRVPSPPQLHRVGTYTPNADIT